MKTMYRVVLAAACVVCAALPAPPAVAHEEAHRHATAPDFGHGADPASATRTVTVTMSDAMRFSPDHLDVEQGEILRIHLVNAGQAEHEFVLGDRAAIVAHAEMMKRMPGMVHREPNMLRLPAGGEGDITWAFTAAGAFVFACQVPGHQESGMEGTITVRPAAHRSSEGPGPSYGVHRENVLE